MRVLFRVATRGFATVKRKLHILVAEDNRDIRDFMIGLLRPELLTWLGLCPMDESRPRGLEMLLT